MSLRKLAWLFWTTLWIGAGAGLLVGLAMALGDAEFRSLGLMNIGLNMASMAMAGMMFGVLSQMVFFAYMTLNYIARDMFRKPSTWVLVQLFFILTVPFEIYFFIWHQSLLGFVAVVGGILAASLLTAWWKVKQTKPTAFIPTLFFLFVGTLLEVTIAIKLGNMSGIVLMTISLLACNSWQIMQLHKLAKTD